MDAVTGARGAASGLSRGGRQTSELERLVDELEAKCGELEARLQLERARGDAAAARAVEEKQREVDAAGQEASDLRDQLGQVRRQLESEKARQTSKHEEQRLRSEAREKDALNRKLREALRLLEGKLQAVMVSQADGVMKESSWREQEAQDRVLKELQERNAKLEERVRGLLGQQQGMEQALELKRREVALQHEEIVALRTQAETATRDLAEARALAQHMQAAGGGVRVRQGWWASSPWHLLNCCLLLLRIPKTYLARGSWPRRRPTCWRWSGESSCSKRPTRCWNGRAGSCRAG